jgi:uncharacterized protein YdeI (YjbR/CyaY-like superfamily)
MNPKVDNFFSKDRPWKAELSKLRKIAQSCSLTEELKWGKPCYCFGESNIVILAPFKAYCALLFFKGALLSDPHGILVQPGEHTQAARQIRFTSARQIKEMESIIRAYMLEAIGLEKAGVKAPVQKNRELPLPEELLQKFKTIPGLKSAFFALTPGRQRAYHIFFTAAKQAKTREARIVKFVPKILAGKGMND